jgi:hypothetical protein
LARIGPEQLHVVVKFCAAQEVLGDIEIEVYEAIDKMTEEEQKHLAQAWAVFEGSDSTSAGLVSQDGSDDRIHRCRYQVVVLKEAFQPITAVRSKFELVQVLIGAIKGMRFFDCCRNHEVCMC